MGLREFLSEAVDVVEIAVGFVFVFLVQFRVVEAFIIILGDFWSRGPRAWGDNFLCDMRLGLLDMMERYCSSRQSIGTSKSRRAQCTTRLVPQHFRCHRRLVRPGSVDLCLATVCADSAKDAAERIGTRLCSLDFHGLTHDRAAAGEDLKIGHGSSTWRNMASGSGEGTKSGRRSLVEEGTHGTRLPEESLHCQELSGDMMNLYSLFLNCYKIQLRVEYFVEKMTVTL